MRFGKINYLNLLPFHLFMKRYLKSMQAKKSFEYHSGVPSHINAAFKSRRIDAAFISSIESRGKACLDLGIVAKKEVLSVLVIPGAIETDSASATSNVLAHRLGIKGRVIIGDRALRYALKHDDYIDLAQAWYETYRLPFVFARLCYHKEGCQLKKLARAFKKEPKKIPYYQLLKASKRSGIPMKEIQNYLNKISYTIDSKAKQALKKFL